MNIAQATGILKPKTNDMAGLKSAYREACKLYHPDVNPNSLEMMKLVNVAYEFLKANPGKWSIKDAPAGPGLDVVLNDIFDKIKHFANVKAEICGCWMWLSGETWRYKKELKELGFRWAPNKRRWYWRQDGYKKRTKKIFSMDEIRNFWGSQELDQEPLTAVA